jgi:predicted HTH domain antitoxin
MSVTLEIPADVVESVRVPPQEVETRLRLELAVALYTQQLLSGGKAATLAGVTRWEWEDLLAHRQITRHYDDEDAATDMAYGQGGR